MTVADAVETMRETVVHLESWAKACERLVDSDTGKLLAGPPRREAARLRTVIHQLEHEPMERR